MGHELEDVKHPFIAQLQALGWTHVEGAAVGSRYGPLWAVMGNPHPRH